jgi:hypothetical protein
LVKFGIILNYSQNLGAFVRTLNAKIANIILYVLENVHYLRAKLE